MEPQLPTWWDFVIVVLTLASLAGLFFEWLYSIEGELKRALHWFDNAVCLVFIAEFGLRLWMAPRRLEFVRRNWIDIVGAIPSVDVLRGVRLIRFVRVLRVTRFFAIFRRLARRYDVPLPKGALLNLLLTTVFVWLASAAAFYRFEAGENEGIESFTDAAWWSMTTLSTVGYGDLYPVTTGGRLVAVLTMVLGIGLLGAVAATTATVFIEFRERGKKGLRGHVMRDHLLVLGWNYKGARAIENFREDPRHASTDILIVCEAEQNPVDDPDIRFVRGSPGKVSILKKASAEKAGAAIVLASRPTDARSDHESALVITSLRRLNPHIRIGVEMVDPDNREHLTYAGCDAIIDDGSTIANLLVRSVQDVGVSDVVLELINSTYGSEIYRVSIDNRFSGKTWADYAKHMVDEHYVPIGISRDDENLVNPEPSFVLRDGDEAFIVSHEPPVL